MSMFLLQSALWLLGAFLLGYLIGYVLKGVFCRRAVAKPVKNLNQGRVLENETDLDEIKVRKLGPTEIPLPPRPARPDFKTPPPPSFKKPVQVPPPPPPRPAPSNWPPPRKPATPPEPPKPRVVPEGVKKPVVTETKADWLDVARNTATAAGAGLAVKAFSDATKPQASDLPKLDKDLPKVSVDYTVTDINADNLLGITTPQGVELPDLTVQVDKPQVTLPDAHLPKLDLSSVEVDVPTVNLSSPELNLPKVDINLPKVELKTSELDLALPKVELPKLDVPLPKGDLPTPELNLPKVDLDLPELQAAKVNVDLPELQLAKAAVDLPTVDSDLPKVNLPKLDGDLPKVDLSTPELNLPEADLDLPKVDVDLPKVNSPKLDVDWPTLDLNLSKANVELPTVNVDVPNVDVPDIEITKPDTSLNLGAVATSVAGVAAVGVSGVVDKLKGAFPAELPSAALKVEASLPVADVTLPKVALDLPKVDINLPEVDVALPKVDLPSVDVALPKADLPSVDVALPKVDLPIFAVDLPSAEIELPQINVPKADLDLPNADLNLTTLEAKLPELSLPTVNGDVPKVDLPDIEITKPDTSLSLGAVAASVAGAAAVGGGSLFDKVKGAFQAEDMPSADVKIDASLPKVNVDLASAELELPKVDVTSPVVVAELPTGALNPPELGISLPKVDLPTIDVDLPTVDIERAKSDVNLPEADLALPKVDLDLPQLNVPKADVHLPKVNLDLPTLEASLPEVSLSSVDAVLPKLEADLPKIDVDLPQVNLAAPDLSVNQPELIEKLSAAVASVAGGAAMGASGLVDKVKDTLGINAPNHEANVPKVDLDLAEPKLDLTDLATRYEVTEITSDVLLDRFTTVRANVDESVMEVATNSNLNLLSGDALVSLPVAHEHYVVTEIGVDQLLGQSKASLATEFVDNRNNDTSLSLVNASESLEPLQAEHATTQWSSAEVNAGLLLEQTQPVIAYQSTDIDVGHLLAQAKSAIHYESSDITAASTLNVVGKAASALSTDYSNMLEVIESKIADTQQTLASADKPMIDASLEVSSDVGLGLNKPIETRGIHYQVSDIDAATMLGMAIAAQEPMGRQDESDSLVDKAINGVSSTGDKLLEGVSAVGENSSEALSTTFGSASAATLALGSGILGLAATPQSTDTSQWRLEQWVRHMLSHLDEPTRTRRVVQVWDKGSGPNCEQMERHGVLRLNPGTYDKLSSVHCGVARPGFVAVGGDVAFLAVGQAVWFQMNGILVCRAIDDVHRFIHLNLDDVATNV